MSRNPATLAAWLRGLGSFWVAECRPDHSFRQHAYVKRGGAIRTWAVDGHRLQLDRVASSFCAWRSYLAAHRGREAAAEFQKILDHRGIVLSSAIGALAHLELGRACVQQRETSKARTAYQDFLTLWKDADPNPHSYRCEGRVREAPLDPIQPSGFGEPSGC